MKKNKSLIIILSILVAITAVFIIKNSNTTLQKELRDFAVKDTAAMTKIFLADRNGNEITLERKNKGPWLLNGKDEPKPDFLKIFLEVIYRVDVRTQVAKAAYNNVIKSLASSGIKCEIYLNSEQKPFKTYYVGGQTEDALGTFMILENSSMPFITNIPGFNGYLTPRYSVSLDAWKNTVLFRLKPNELRTLSVIYNNFPEKSFTITPHDGNYLVENKQNNSKINKVDSIAVENYLSLFSTVYFEGWVHNLKSNTMDSIMHNPPSISISLSKINEQAKEIDIYPMPLNEASLTRQDTLGNLLKYDVDRMYGVIKPGNEFIIVQHYTFDKLFRQFSDFDANRPKPKAMRNR